MVTTMELVSRFKGIDRINQTNVSLTKNDYAPLLKGSRKSFKSVNLAISGSKKHSRVNSH